MFPQGINEWKPIPLIDLPFQSKYAIFQEDIYHGNC